MELLGSDNKMTQPKKLALKILFWVYIAIVFRITVFRSGFGFDHLFQNGNINLTLFCDYIPLIREGHWYMFMYLFVGNIIWFIPFGFYLRYTGKPKGILRITICGFFLSLTIETLQYVFGTGYSELDDLVLNTFGVWIGAVSGRWFRNCA